MSKIYVVAPSSINNGGSESLHQLVYKLDELGFESYIYYKNPHINHLVKKFDKYSINVASKIDDTFDNLIIVPEVFTGFLKKYKNIKKAIWWLSLDFHFRSIPSERVKKNLYKRNLPLFFQRPIELGLLITRRTSIDDYRLIDLEKEGNAYFHFYNTEYVKSFLFSKGIRKENMNYLCGPISDKHFQGNEKLDKDNQLIIYNPSKGMDYTEKLINYSKEKNLNINFKALKGYSEDEMIELEKKATIYIDFGFFPGPERIPRESVLHKCLIITGVQGAAGNDEDVKIPRKYKFETTENNIKKILYLIVEMTSNYEKFVDDFKDYREKVSEQRDRFDNDIRKIGILMKGSEK